MKTVTPNAFALHLDDPNLEFIFDDEMELNAVETGDEGFTDEEAAAFLRGEIGQNVLVADASEQTGAMIALVPDETTLDQLVIAGGESRDELHLTICYLGDAAKIVPDVRENLLRSMLFASHEMPVVDANAFGVAEWNPHDEQKDTALVYSVGGEELEYVYEMLWQGIKSAMGDRVPDQYEPWVPHVCAAYSDDISLLNVMVQNLGPVRFDRIRVAFAGEVTDYPLYNGEQPDVTPGDTEMSDEEDYSLTASGEYYAVTFANALDRESRMRAAKSGKAMPDGSYPIRNVGELQKAIQAYGRSGNKAATKRWIMRRARELNRTDLIPDNWGSASLRVELDTLTEALAQQKESDVNLPGGNHNLRNYWTRGPGAAKIGWGTDGSFRRCVALLGRHVSRPQGLCAEYHHAATGEWPTEHGKAGIPSSVDVVVVAAGEALKADDDGWWEGILAVEDVETGDQRKFAAGSIVWPDPSFTTMPLMWTPESQGEHKGAVMVGNIGEVWRDPVDARIVRGRGRFDLDGENGREAHRQVKGGFLSGISIDPDQVTDADVELIYPATFDGKTAAKPELTVYHAGRIRGATLVPFPAFVEAKITLTSEDSDVAEITVDTDASSVVACGDVQHPKREWFDDPKLNGPSPITVTDEGHVFGHAALWDTCHTSFANACVAPPYEKDYSYFMTGEVVCDDGDRVAAGQITLGTSHAPTSGVTLNAAIDHYGNTGTAVADVAAGADEFGIWVAGAVRPGTSGQHLHALRASALSGDWRRVGGALRMVALLAVNVPGFPVPRTSAFMAADRQLSLVAAGVVDPVQLEVDALAVMIGRKKKRKVVTYNDEVHALALSIGRDPLSLLRQEVLG